MTEGKKYIIDKDYNNGGEVVLVKIIGKYTCIVRDEETNSEWHTMINRLSEIATTNTNQQNNK